MVCVSALIVGGGWSGLYALKWLRQKGIDAAIFEQDDDIGGIWRYKEDCIGGVFQNSHATSSKTFLHASDFPFPDNGRDFPSHTDVINFLRDYVEHFKLRSFIQLQRRVTRICLVSSTETGRSARWNVHYECVNGQRKASVATFNAVILACGQHQVHHIPQNPAFASFSGRLLHSSRFKWADGTFRDQRVLVVGGGESAADIAAEITQVAKEVHMSIRNGVWFHDRTLGAKQPADVVFTKHQRIFTDYESLPIQLGRRLLMETMWGGGGSGVPEWIPETGYLRSFINKSRDVVRLVALGKVIPHRKIDKIQNKTVVFAEGGSIQVDIIVLATGYDWAAPPIMVEDGSSGNSSKLEVHPSGAYGMVFHPEHPSLCFVGSARPVFGSIPSLAELQARWVANVLAGQLLIPKSDEMQVEIIRDQKRSRMLYGDRANRLLVNHFEYSDRLAKELHCNPYSWTTALTRPRLFWVLLNSPWTAFHYRIVGKDADEGAASRLRQSWPILHYPFDMFYNLVVFIDICALTLVLGGVTLMYYMTFHLPWGFGLL